MTMPLKISNILHESLVLAAKARKVSKSEVVRNALEENLAHDLTNAADAPSAALVWVQTWSGKFNPTHGQMPLPGSAPADARLKHIIDKHLH